MTQPEIRNAVPVDKPPNSALAEPEALGRPGDAAERFTVVLRPGSCLFLDFTTIAARNRQDN